MSTTPYYNNTVRRKNSGMLYSYQSDNISGGINQSKSAQNIEENECVFLQDLILDTPGVARQRGPVAQSSGTPTYSGKAIGIVNTVDPAGTQQIAVLHGTSTPRFGVVSGSSSVDIPWEHNFSTSPHTIVDYRSALSGGIFVGTSSGYGETASQSLGLWRGGTKVNYTTGTISVSMASTTVTGSGTSWSSNVSPGMFVFATSGINAPFNSGISKTFVGTVRSVDSNTQLTLEKPSRVGVTNGNHLETSIRGFNQCVSVGAITTSTSDQTVTGAKTKFVSNGLTSTSAQWALYRLRDYAYIGKVDSSSALNFEGSLELTATAAIALSNEDYIAYRIDGNWDTLTNASSTKMGFLTATFANRQWYANKGGKFSDTYRVFFSQDSEFECVDNAANDGDFIDVISSTGVQTPIMGLIPTYNALLVMKESEVHGISGTAPSNFQMRKLSDDGTLACTSIQGYRGGALWAGRNGIYFYDGTEVSNISSDKLGKFYSNSLKNFNPNTHRMWSMIARDHYFLFIESFESTYSLYKETTPTTPTKICFVVDLYTNSFTTLTNTHILGSTSLTAVSGETAYYIINTSTTGYIVNASDLFTNTGEDSLVCSGAVSGPDIHLESRRYQFGDGTSYKVFREFLQYYRIFAGYLNVDILKSLGQHGSLAGTIPATDYTWKSLGERFDSWDSAGAAYTSWDALNLDHGFEVTRIRFARRGPVFGYRLWKPTGQQPFKAQFGPAALRYKEMRTGRAG